MTLLGRPIMAEPFETTPTDHACACGKTLVRILPSRMLACPDPDCPVAEPKFALP